MSGQHPPNGETEIAAIPKGLRILAMFLRALVFLAACSGVRGLPGDRDPFFQILNRGEYRKWFKWLRFAQRHTGLGLISDLCSLRSQWSLPSGSGYGLRQLRGAVRRML